MPSLRRWSAGDLLTVEEVRKILRVGRNKVYGLCGAGVLPSLRLRQPGKRRGPLRIPREELDSYIQSLFLERTTALDNPPTEDPDEILRRVEEGD